MNITNDKLLSLSRYLPGDFGIYRLEQNVLKPLFVSPNVHTLSGMTADEYTAATVDDATAIVLKSDLPFLRRTIADCIENSDQSDALYRIIHKSRGFEWIRARMKVIGTMNGDPVILSFFTTSAPEKNIYQTLLDKSHSMIYVCDRNTYELLYLNEAAKKYAYNKGDDFVGKPCHMFVRGNSDVCDECYLNQIKAGEDLDIKSYDERHNCWEKVSGIFTSWCGRDAFIVFIDDISETMERQSELADILKAEKRIVEDFQILNGKGDVSQHIGKVLSNILTYLGADRTYIVLFKSSCVPAFSEVCRGGIDPDAASLSAFTRDSIKSWLPSFFEHRAVTVANIDDITDPAEHDLMSKRGARVYIEAPLFEGNELIGLIGADNPAPQKLKNTSEPFVALAYAIAATLLNEENRLELVETTKRYQLAVDGAKLGVWEYNIKEHCIISPSHSFKQFGVPDIITNVPGSILHLFKENDRPRLIEMFEKLESGVPTVEGEFWMKWKEDTPLRCERVFYTVVKDADGSPSVAYGIGMDMTAQKQEEERYYLARGFLEDAHKHSLGSFRLNLTNNWCGDCKSSPDFVQRLQASGTVDGYFEEFSRLIADEDIKSRFNSRFRRELLTDAFSRGITHESIQYPTVYKDGTRHWRDMQLYMLQNPLTGDIEAMTFAIDIDDQKKSELITKRLTTENFDYIGLIDPNTRSLELKSGHSEKLFGMAGSKLNYDDVFNSVGSRFVAPDDREHYFSSVSLDAVISGLRVNGSYSASYKRLDGGIMSRRSLQYHWLDRPGGEILIVSTNITTAYEQELKHSDDLNRALDAAKSANAMKTEFLSNVSHDMRTPLNAVLGYARLARGTEDVAVVRDYLDKIEKAGNVLFSLINDTLDLSKIETGAVTLKPSPIQCGEVIQKIIASVRPAMDAKHIRFTVDNSRAVMATINVDGLRLQEIFMNLLSNAIKFTPEGGKITLVVECVKLERNCVHDRLIVRDTGCGMSSEFLPKVFEPFSQERTSDNANVEGSGLGLSIVKRIVELMGGTIDVFSEPGKGTEFVILLDFERMDDSLAEDIGNTASRESINGKNILLFEDNAMNTEIAKSLLEMAGAHVVCAENGKVGCDIFKESSPGEFDAILMDIRMPLMNGYEATTAIRDSGRPDSASIPIIAMTADAYDNDVRRCGSVGMNGHISKPIDPETMYRAIAQGITLSKKEASE